MADKTNLFELNDLSIIMLRCEVKINIMSIRFSSLNTDFCECSRTNTCHGDFRRQVKNKIFLLYVSLVQFQSDSTRVTVCLSHIKCVVIIVCCTKAIKLNCKRQRDQSNGQVTLKISQVKSSWFSKINFCISLNLQMNMCCLNWYSTPMCIVVRLFVQLFSTLQSGFKSSPIPAIICYMEVCGHRP